MQKILKIIFVVTFVAFGIFAFSARTQEANFSIEKSLVANEATSPRSLYLKNCARCHGADGKSGTELGRNLQAPDLTEEKPGTNIIIRVVTKGKGDMPAFGKKLKKREIASLAKYVRSL